MPIHLPFKFPYFYNNYRYQYNSINSNRYSTNTTDKLNSHQYNRKNEHDCQTSFQYETEKNSENSDRGSAPESSECFFEIFGLKLHFDDVLIMCILFFLYKEEVQDEELFLCLILLLIS